MKRFFSCACSVRALLISRLFAITIVGVLSGAVVTTSSAFAANAPVNINKASTAQLALELNGIGPSKAEAIVRYREEHGAFKTVDDLVNVKGIGPKTLEKLRSQIVAGEYIEPAAGESLLEQETAARDAVQAVLKRSLEIRQSVPQHE